MIRSDEAVGIIGRDIAGEVITRQFCPAGTILGFKDYNVFRRLWSKLSGKSLPYNKFTILPFAAELADTVPARWGAMAYEPVRKYNKRETNKLNKLQDELYNCGWDTVKAVVNSIRPDTFNDTVTLDNCKYYRKWELHVG